MKRSSGESGRDSSLTTGGAGSRTGRKAQKARSSSGPDADGAPQWPAGVLRREDHERAAGGDEQQDQDAEADGLRVPGPGVLQAEGPGDPRDEVRSVRVAARA